MGSLFKDKTPALTPEVAKVRDEALEFLPHEPQEAFKRLVPLFAFEDKLATRADLQAALGATARVSDALQLAEFAQRLRTAALDPDDVDVLYEVANEAYEHQLYDLAATVLRRAHRLAPHSMTLLSELVANLEQLAHNHEAVEYLKAARSLEEEPLHRYLLGFNSLMIGDLQEPRRQLPALRQVDDAEFSKMADYLETVLIRAESLLDLDLRGWHLAINGCLLLHVEESGFEEGMNGRFAYVGDSFEMCRSGIEMLRAVLNELSIEVGCVYSPADRCSRILATAVAELLELPLKSDRGNGPGLIVAYDLGDLEWEELEWLGEHRPGQVLWGHSSCWTAPSPFAPDITTYLYQARVKPWGPGRMRMDPESQEVELLPPDDRSVEELAREIVNAEYELHSRGGLEALLDFCRNLARIPTKAEPCIRLQEGSRLRQRVGSPITSSRFL